ncbi:unnamed protein product [Ilex paraguariensis]|uniref:Uncharacterized protein n=1 Tax=Ilex paraguariensis TaxID=185542 RepID=A0ABC8RX96_9AQUA
MSRVVVFKDNGVIQFIENPQAEQGDGRGGAIQRKVLVHLPTGQVVSSYHTLEDILKGLGWERYYGGNPDLYQFHKQSSIDLISLPKDFSKFNSVYMYDIVIKNPNVFHVRDIKSVNGWEYPILRSGLVVEDDSVRSPGERGNKRMRLHVKRVMKLYSRASSTCPCVAGGCFAFLS